MTLALSILGVSGKMGTRVLELALKDPFFHMIVGGTRQKLTPPSKELISLFSDPKAALTHCDVAIDFTSPDAIYSHLEAATTTRKALVIGTTGHDSEQKAAIEKASQTIPILFSPNFSLGVALCLEAVARFAQALNNICTIDIVETHHVHKKDCPSGTALALAQAMGKPKVVLENSHAKPRQKDTIVIHSIRAGEVVGEHTVIFECGHERIELKHIAYSRDAFAQGALMAAKFLVKQPPGLYSLKDLFSF